MKEDPNLSLVLELLTGPFLGRLLLRHGGVALNGEPIASLLEVPATGNAGSQTATAAARQKRGSEMRETGLISERRSRSEWN